MTTTDEKIAAWKKELDAKEADGIITDSTDFLEEAAGAAERLLGIGRYFQAYYFGEIDPKMLALCVERLAEAIVSVQKIQLTVMDAMKELPEKSEAAE